MNEIFRKFAHAVSEKVGSVGAFIIAVIVVVAWVVTGPIFGFSDTWQLIINTSTTIVTFLMVFLIQNTQNRDNHALHLKIDELLRALDAADTRLVDLEERSEQELEKLHERYKALALHTGASIEASQPEQTDRRAGRRPRNDSLGRRIQDP